MEIIKSSWYRGTVGERHVRRLNKCSAPLEAASCHTTSLWQIDWLTVVIQHASNFISPPHDDFRSVGEIGSGLGAVTRTRG